VRSRNLKRLAQVLSEVNEIQQAADDLKASPVAKAEVGMDNATVLNAGRLCSLCCMELGNKSTGVHFVQQGGRHPGLPP
jgi:hypothetical protein